MRESINRAFAYLMGQKVKMGIGQQVDTTDFHVEAIDLLCNHVAALRSLPHRRQMYRSPQLVSILVLG
jgi:hypothetical protein